MKQTKDMYKIQNIEEVVHYLERAQEIYRRLYTGKDDGIYSTIGNMGAYNAVTEVLNFIKGKLPDNENEYNLINNLDEI